MKKCDICREPYYRRNKIEAWTRRNPGKRTGWKKEFSFVCLNCHGVVQSERLLVMANITLVNVKEKKRAQR